MNREQRPTKGMRIKCKHSISSCIDGSKADRQSALDELQNLLITQAPFARNYTAKLLRDSQWLETVDSSVSGAATSVCPGRRFSWPRTTSTAASSSSCLPATSAASPQPVRSAAQAVGKGERQGGKQSKAASPWDVPQGPASREYQQEKQLYQHQQGIFEGGKSMSTGGQSTGTIAQGKNMITGGPSKGTSSGGRSMSTAKGGKNARIDGKNSWKGCTIIMQL